jgi:hypothetical protein
MSLKEYRRMKFDEKQAKITGEEHQKQSAKSKFLTF